MEEIGDEVLEVAGCCFVEEPGEDVHEPLDHPIWWGADSLFGTLVGFESLDHRFG